MDVIRTGGPAVTEDVLGELVVSTRVLGSKEIMLLNHTGCGFTTFTDKELNDKLARETGDATPVPMRLFSFKDPEENTRAQIAKVRSHPWIAKDVPVRGFIFDVDTGRLREVNVNDRRGRRRLRFRGRVLRGCRLRAPEMNDDYAWLRNVRWESHASGASGRTRRIQEVNLFTRCLLCLAGALTLLHNGFWRGLRQFLR